MFSDTVAVLVNEPASGGVLSINQGVICQGESTGDLLLSGYTGNIWSWRKRINGTAWQAIENNSESYNENPALNGVWEYQAITTKEAAGIAILYCRSRGNCQFTGGILTGGNICSGSMCPLMF